MPASQVPHPRLTAVLAGLAALLAGQLTPAGDAPARTVAQPDQELASLFKLYAGSYLSPPEEGVRESRPILLRVVAVQPPPGHGRALYSEMRHDGPDGELYRQNLLVFAESPDGQGYTMTALNFSDREAATGLLTNPALLVSAGLSTTPGLGPGCTMAFRRQGDGFFGRIDPDNCVITSRNGETRHIEAETFLREDAIEQLERGYTPDGRLLFGNPDGVRYVWPRLP